jgi:anthranilate 1,2-dioxygenase ferredoxin subunit
MMATDKADELTFRAVAPEAEIPLGQVKGYVVDGWPVLLANLPDGVFAMLDRCSHAAARLSDGRLRRNAISCHMHGALFQVPTGRCVGEHYRPVRTFPVNLRNGWIEVGIPVQPPGPDQLPIIAGF